MTSLRLATDESYGYEGESEDGDRATVEFNLAGFAEQSEMRLASAALPAREPPTVPRGLSVLPDAAKPDVEAAKPSVDGEMPRSPRSESGCRLRSMVDTIAPSPSMNQTAYATVADDDLAWFEWDDATKKVLSRVDGETTVQDVIATAGLPAADTLRILGELAVLGIIGFR